MLRVRIARREDEKIVILEREFAFSVPLSRGHDADSRLPAKLAWQGSQGFKAQAGQTPLTRSLG
jgi:hypothetical protein